MLSFKWYRDEASSFDDRTVRRNFRIGNIFSAFDDSREGEFVAQTLRNVRVLVVAGVAGLEVEQVFQEVRLSRRPVRGKVVYLWIVPLNNLKIYKCIFIRLTIFLNIWYWFKRESTYFDLFTKRKLKKLQSDGIVVLNA